MRIKAVMSKPVISISPNDTVISAADAMRRHAIGALPVLEQGRPVGMITDRDIVIRAVSGQRDINSLLVREAMSAGPVSCRADQTVSEAAAIMGDVQVKRLLVLDKSKYVVGVLSLGDIARDVSEELAGQALGEVSEFRKSVCRKTWSEHRDTHRQHQYSH